jgi:ABC-2 type transport system ATP-binding protein
VDPVSRRDFWRILYQLVRDGVTLFVSTAYLDEAERCNRLALLHKGKLLAVGTPEEVKTMMPGTLWEVRGPEPRQLAQVLRDAFPAPENTVGLFGDRVHLAVRDGAQVEKRIRDVLDAQHVSTEGIRPIEPSLEDVFVSVLTGTAESKGGA